LARSAYANIRPRAIEAPFQLYLRGWLLRGRIDAVYRTADGYDVIDYKTGVSPRDPASAALQLAVYRLAWAGIADVPLTDVGAGFLYVRTGEIVRPPDLPDAGGLAAVLMRRCLTGRCVGNWVKAWREPHADDAPAAQRP